MRFGLKGALGRAIDAIRRRLDRLRASLAELGRARKRASRSEDRCRRIVDVAGDGICVVDGAGRIAVVNQQVERLLGSERERLIGRELEGFLDDESRGRLHRVLDAPTEAYGHEFDCQLRRQDGQAVWVIATLRSLAPFGDHPSGAVLTFADITDRKRVEEALSWEFGVNVALADLAGALIGALSIEDISSLVLQHAARLTASAFGYVGYSDSRAGTLVFGTASPETDEEADGSEPRPPERSRESRLVSAAELDALLGWSSECKSSVLCNRVADAAAESGSSGTIRRFLAAPALADGEVVGQIVIANAEHDYSERDRQFLERLAGLYAVALERKQAVVALRKERDFTNAIVDTVASLIVIVDRQGRIVRFNQTCERVTGYASAEVLGRSCADLFLDPEERDQVEQDLSALRAGRIPSQHESHWRTRSGESRFIAWTNTALLDDAGGVEYVVGTGTDVTDVRQAEAALQAANAKLLSWVGELEQRNRETTILNEMGDLLQTCLSISEAYSVIARAAQDLFPDDAGELLILSASRNLVEAVLSWGDGSAGEQVFSPDECWALRRGRAYRVTDARRGLPCGHLEGAAPTGYICVPLVAHGEALGVMHLRVGGSATSGGGRPREGITDEKERLIVALAEHGALALANLRLRDTLRNQAIRDTLTGLFNRRYLEETFERELLRAKRRATPLSVMMIDLDHFKGFNDVHGHGAGDALLRSIGSYLRGRVRGEDVACRYGGEEFTILLPDAALEVAQRRAEELREGVKRLQVEYRGQPLGGVTLSVGVASFPRHGKTADDVLRSADAALYRAKTRGRDRVEAAVELDTVGALSWLER